MTGTGSAMVSTPAIAHSDPTILPQTPTGLQQSGQQERFHHPAKLQYSATINIQSR
jgi:hypothetical protein